MKVTSWHHWFGTCRVSNIGILYFSFSISCIFCKAFELRLLLCVFQIALFAWIMYLFGICAKHRVLAIKFLMHIWHGYIRVTSDEILKWFDYSWRKLWTVCNLSMCMWVNGRIWAAVDDCVFVTLPCWKCDKLKSQCFEIF